MDRLSSDILLSIFKRLDCQETVSIMRACTSWYQVIEENKSLWGRLVVPKRKSREVGLNPSVLAKFDERSGSSLQKVSIFIDSKMKGKSKPASILQVLERSKDLKCCQFISDSWTTRVKLFTKGGDEVTNEGNKSFSSLKVLWSSVVEPTFTLHPQVLNSLSSLRLDGSLKESLLRELLDKASRTLKHLGIHPMDGEEDQIQLHPLHFPNLQVVEITVTILRHHLFPSWIQIPSTAMLIMQRLTFLPLDLPSVSSLWFFEDSHVTRLISSCPLLKTMRWDKPYSSYECNPTFQDDLLERLEERKRMADQGVEIDGIAMNPLKTLILPSDFSFQSNESRWQDLGVERINSQSSPSFVKVVI